MNVGEAFQGSVFQLIDKSKGLFRTTKVQEGEIVYLDFHNEFAPMTDVFGLGKGIDPLEYEAVIGSKNIVHSLRVLFFMKIPPEIKEKMKKLSLW
jgi:hypothetical protein